MTKKEYYASYTCCTQGPDDYVFMPFARICVNQIVGVNCTKPYFIIDSPDNRRREHQREKALALKQRLDNGEYLYPQPENVYPPSFSINEKFKFGFGSVTYTRGGLRDGPDTRGYLYGGFRLEDEIIVEIRGYNYANKKPLQIIL